MDRNRRAAEKAAADHIAGGKPACGMARGLTLLARYRHGQFHLGVNTDKGILDGPRKRNCRACGRLAQSTICFRMKRARA